MATERKRLGRGLETLLGRIGSSSTESETLHFTEEQQMSPPDKIDNKIDVMKIEPNPFQPRKVFDETEIEQLAQSLQSHGLLSPIAVRQVGERYQIIAGERRFRAAMRLGWSEIPVHLYDADDQQMAELALTENIQRKDLNAIEKALSFANYLEMYPDTTHERLAERLSISRPAVTNLLRLLDLPGELQDAVAREILTQTHARALLPLKNEWEMIEVSKKIQDEGWSVRETERFVQDLLQTGEAVNPKQPEKMPEKILRIAEHQSEQIQQLENEFRHCLGGTKVKLTQTNEKGKGKLVISFANHAEFEQIYATICQSRRAVG